MEEKIEFIDDFLMRCEDWMHGQDGEDVTKCRKYLIEIQEQVKNRSIPNVVGQSEQYHCELHDFGRQNNPCSKQCDGCKAMNLD